jgi:fructose-bisphosphate aldolase class II
MSVHNMTKLLQHARENKYAVPSFNLLNLDSIRAVVETAEAEDAPVIVATLEKGLISTGVKQFAAVVRAWGEEVRVPVVIHLDHAGSLEIIGQCLDAGFTSVMFDGSHLPLPKNIELTNKVIEMASEYDASVEAELGRVPGIEGGKVVKEEEETFTDLEEAITFCKHSAVDGLAVSIGTVHFYQTKLLNPNIDLLKTLRANLDTPLVLHGGASVTDFKVVEMVKAGITKYNINYKINRPFLDGLIAALAVMEPEVSPGRFSVNPPAIVASGQERVATVTRDYLRLLGTSGKAGLFLQSTS